MASLLNIGVSGLIAHQTALTTVGNNISNANVEGYSRQEATFAARNSQLGAAGFIGAGVEINSIRRIANQFTANRLQDDIARAESLGVLSAGFSELDNLLANENTGLSSVLDDLFSAIQSASESPSSLPLRQQVLGQADRFVSRYQDINSVLASASVAVNENIDSLVGEVNRIAASIAEINQTISASTLRNGSQANDLLDQRDQLLRDLSEKINYSASTQDGDFVNIYLASGQALVLGTNASSLSVIDGEQSADRSEIAISVSGGALQRVSNAITGGQLGGQLRFRSEAIDVVSNEIGVVATLATNAFNLINRQGVDLNGEQGTDIFTSINDRSATLGRVSYAPGNSSSSAIASISISDVSLLQASDYRLDFTESGSSTLYTLTRLSDGSQQAQGILASGFPQTLAGVDGFEINLETPGYAGGDSLTLSPARLPSENVQVLLNSPASLAFGLPLSVQASNDNQGSATILQPEASSLVSLSDDQSSASAQVPLLVRFNSATSYDILDNSNPANPVEFVPPLSDISFAAGQLNTVLQANTPISFITSNAGFSTSATAVANGAVGNDNPGETVTVARIGSESSVPQTVNVLIPADSSAEQAAALLSAEPGLQASASNTLVLRLDGDTTQTGFTLNGVDITSPALGSVPANIDVDFLAGRINTALGGSGVSAVSDGTNLTIESSTGSDLVVSNTGGTGQDIEVLELNGVPQGSPIELFSTVDIPGQNQLTAVGSVVLQSSGVVSLSSNGGFFASNVETQSPILLGFDVQISGVPQAGDEFTIEPGFAGAGDNRNALAFASLQRADVISGGGSLTDIYASIVATVGVATASANIDSEAAASLRTQSEQQLQSESGVNLDEEAAKLLQYEQAYNASAQVIAVARTIFDSLLAAFR